MDDDLVDIKQILRVLWKNKIFIIVFSLLGTFLVALNVHLRTPMYTAKSSLLIMPPKLTTSLSPKFLPPSIYMQLGLSDHILHKVITTLDIKTSKGKPLPVESLRSQMEIAEVVGKEEKGPEDAHMLLLIVRGSDPKQTSEVANTWAQLIAEESQSIRASEINTITQRIKTNYEAVKKALATTEKKLTVHMQKISASETALMELKRTEITSLTNRIGNIQNDMADKRGYLSALNKELQRLPKTIIAYQSIPGEALWAAIASKSTTIDKLKDLKIKSEEENWTFRNFSDQASETRVEVNRMERMLQYLRKQLAQTSHEIEEYKLKHDPWLIKKTELTRTFDSLTSEFETLSERYYKSRNILMEKTSDIRLISKSAEPQIPDSFNKKKAVLIAFVIFLALAVLLAFLKQPVSEIIREENP